MRILYTHRTQGVGAEGAHVMGMFEAFQELGHDVRMDCLPGCNPTVDKAPGKSKPKPSIIQKIYWFIAEHSPETVFELFELAYNFPLFIRLAWQYLKFRPDMIYERYALNTFSPTLLCKLTGCKHVLEVNDSVVIERSRNLALKAVAMACEEFCLGGSNLAITITEKFKSQLESQFPVCRGKVLVLTNGISKRRFDRVFDRDGVRKRLGLDSPGLTVLGASGQFLPWHGLGEFVSEIAPFVLERNLHLLFIGDGPVREDILNKATSFGIADRVLFTGMVSIREVPEYLSALDIAVIPSAAKHASPMKLMEYMGMGLPIVAPNLPSIRAAAPTDDMISIFHTEDKGGMLNQIQTLLAARDFAKEQGRCAKNHIMSNLTWTRHASVILDKLVAH